jgi:hypothetical protein
MDAMTRRVRMDDFEIAFPGDWNARPTVVYDAPVLLAAPLGSELAFLCRANRMPEAADVHDPGFVTRLTLVLDAWFPDLHLHPSGRVDFVGDRLLRRSYFGARLPFTPLRVDAHLAVDGHVALLVACVGGREAMERSDGLVREIVATARIIRRAV